MYKVLSEEGMKILDAKINKGQLIISHVGDGEYSCNIFGNIFSSYSKALEMAKKYFKDDTNIEIFTDENYLDFIIAYRWFDSYEGYNALPKIARLTVETLDTDFYPGN
jgi:hypothetical protein